MYKGTNHEHCWHPRHRNHLEGTSFWFECCMSSCEEIRHMNAAERDEEMARMRQQYAFVTSESTVPEFRQEYT